MTRMKQRLLFLIYISLFGLTNGFLNFFKFNKDKKTNGFLNLFNFNKDKGKSEISGKQPFCKNCGKFDNSWNDMISFKLKETQFEKINKCKINRSFYICKNSSRMYCFVYFFSS